MSEIPSIHDQFEEIIGFVIEKCEYEEKHYHMTHALTANEIAPECENVTVPAKFAAWEDPSTINPLKPMGKPGLDFQGNPTDQFNWCPYCDHHVWVSPAFPVGKELECPHCHAIFRRAL